MYSFDVVTPRCEGTRLIISDAGRLKHPTDVLNTHKNRISDNRTVWRKIMKFSHWAGYIIFMLYTAFISIFLRRVFAPERLQNLHRNHPAFLTDRTFGKINA